ncbi:GntT/GntP/DsdX family permease [Arthrobacter sp. H14]|uniref:GntT/GntP/DsdX family permease n=1 Tax=Arthrobacter sp. H14 TaxID=1312959 RepID=UPI003FA42DAF
MDATGANFGFVGELGNPVFAMFLGAGVSYLLARKTLPGREVGSAVSSALTTAGPILVLTGISGSLAMVISASGLDKILAGHQNDVVPAPRLEPVAGAADVGPRRLRRDRGRHRSQLWLCWRTG